MFGSSIFATGGRRFLTSAVTRQWAAMRRRAAEPMPEAIARAVALIGDCSALLVLAALIPGPRRLSDLTTELATMGSTALGHQLDALEDSGLVQQRTVDEPGSAEVYELSDMAEEMQPVLEALVRWAWRP
jgi:DNA-binding HxlR family transcriptional regulator